MTKPRSQVRFLLNGEPHTVDNPPLTQTVLQYLRETLRLTGTKEGCAEGDCGACTVVIAELIKGKIQARAVNACIQFLPTVDGRALFTVDGLRSTATGELHPVQQSMVDCHASQCGFCTPGFVMSLFALYKSQGSANRREINDCLSGNLCRCTGYRPIIDAAGKMYEYAANGKGEALDWAQRPYADSDQNAVLGNDVDLAGALREMSADSGLALDNESGCYFAPTTVAELAQLVLDHPEATLLAGGTDAGLWVTKQLRELRTVIYLGNVEELSGIETAVDHLSIGAAVRLTDAFAELERLYPDLHEVIRRFASPPIRNAATLVGNVANGSPIGDSMPALISLGAALVLRRGGASREMPLEEFYVDYQQTRLRPGEFVQALKVPLPEASTLFRSYKISKRFDQDISAVCGAFRIELEGNKVREARVAFGGMAATPKRAAGVESRLRGRQWTEQTLKVAMGALTSDFAPISDMRASEAYRHRVSANLLKRFFVDTTEPDIATQVWTN